MSNDNLTREEAAARSALVSDVRYDVRLDLTSAEAPTFSSATTVRFTCSEPGASTFLDLDAAAVVEAMLNGKPIESAAFTGSRLRLDDLGATNELMVVADCRYQHTGVGLHRFTDPVDGQTYLYTQFEPFDAHRVFGCFDQPDLKAPFLLAVEAPAGWKAVSNGGVLERPDEGEAGTWRFAETPPLPTYITAVCAGPFHEVRAQYEPSAQAGGEPIDLGLFCRSSLAEYLDPDEFFEITRQGFDFFGECFAYPYPFGGGSGGSRKYDQLLVPEFNAGAMENAACVTFSESYVFRSKVTDANRRRRGETILHEMAHMWFGDLVTMRWWDDLWLNESFATYMAYLAMVSATRFGDAWSDFATELKAWAYNQDQLPSTHPIVADIVDTDAVRTNFDGITYAKGASVLRQLVAWVGDEAFRDGLRQYFRAHDYRNAELRDFLAALEHASGRDLHDWSAQWLETAGLNALRPVVEVANDTYCQVTVGQEASAAHPTVRDHRLRVGLYDLVDDSLVRRRVLELDVTGETTPVSALRGQPVAPLLLINDGDLAYAKIRLDEGSIATAMSSLGRLTDPLARALCWSSAWDMTRDGELAARRYAHIVAEHAPAEADVGVLSSLLRRAETALDRYGDPANRSAARARLADQARAAMEAAPPGDDRQLVWARAFANMAETQQQRDAVAALYDGSWRLDGLVIDTDLRWHLVSVLAVAGDVGDAEITRELERDPTDLGARRAVAARAAQPAPEVKERFWQSLLDDTEMPLATMRAIVGGFAQPGQEGLLQAFTPRYPETVPRIWATRSPEEALLLTGGLFPVPVTQASVEAADRAQAMEGVPPPAQRILSESRDATLRALRARDVDARATA